MESFLEFIFAVVVIAVLSYFKMKGKSDAPDAPTEDPDYEARARRVQEEIRRRIRERQTGGAPSAAPIETVESPPSLPTVAQRERFSEDSSSAAEPDQEKGELQRQQDMAERLRALREAQRAENRAEKEAYALAADGSAAAYNLARSAAGVSRLTLRQPGALRQAFLMKEILDKPVGLR